MHGCFIAGNDQQPAQKTATSNILKKTGTGKFQVEGLFFCWRTCCRPKYTMSEQLHLKPNMTQVGAISFTALYDDRDEKLQQLASYAEETFDVQLRKNLTMLTVRHYNMETVNKLLQGKTTVLTQQTTETIQVIYDV
jgi:hypothetical protein